MNEPETHGCELLDWDSDFFGVRIGRLLTNRLSRAMVEAADQWCAANAIDCLYFLADTTDAQTLRLAEDSGFNLVDIRMTPARRIRAEEPLPDAPASSLIRPALPSDLESLRAIARCSHRDSRFYFDDRFSADRCDSLYETWIEKSCAGRSAAVFVAELRGTPVGYVTCDRVDSATGQIGLLAVGSSAQGLGLGSILVKTAIGWFRRQGFKGARVVTQGRNARAQVCYQRCGFFTQSVQLWYHRWFPGSAGWRGAVAPGSPGAQ